MPKLPNQDPTLRNLKYQIAPSRDYALLDPSKLSPTAPAPAPGLEMPKEYGFAPELAAAPQPEKRAVWVVHGMGQQVPFETLDSLTKGLKDVVQVAPGSSLRMRTVKLGDQTVQRVEMDVMGECGQPLELHLYESYWAPKTEGVAKLTDVVTFLKDGGFRGLINSVKTFRRAMFGSMEDFRVPIRTPFFILLALAVLVALALINTVILAAAATKAGAPLPKSLSESWPLLTAWASWMSAVMIAFGAALMLATMVRPGKVKARYMATKPEKAPSRIGVWWSEIANKVPTVLVWLAFAFTVLSLFFTAFAMSLNNSWSWAHDQLSRVPTGQLQTGSNTAILLTIAPVLLAMTVRSFHRSNAEEFLDSTALFLLLLTASALFVITALLPFGIPLFFGTGQGQSRAISFMGSSKWVWPLLIFVSAQVRELLVQYVGDVAIYITPNKLDRFEEVRAKIKDGCRQLASAIYLALDPNDPGEFLYDHVAVIGHSLGSVVAYDTLNRLMLDDSLAGGRLGVPDRTKTFITFGSPLNKTAFLFSIQGKDNLHVREQLAATVQPLIQSPDFRKLHWINVYSGNDIISGKLTFYDPPLAKVQSPPEWFVRNIADPDARTPLVAHTQYWANSTVWLALAHEIASPSPVRLHRRDS